MSVMLSVILALTNANPNPNPGLLQLGAYTSPTLNLRPKKLHLRTDVVYEFKVTIRAGPGIAGDVNTRCKRYLLRYV